MAGTGGQEQQSKSIGTGNDASRDAGSQKRTMGNYGVVMRRLVVVVVVQTMGMNIIMAQAAQTVADEVGRQDNDDDGPGFVKKGRLVVRV